MQLALGRGRASDYATKDVQFSDATTRSLQRSRTDDLSNAFEVSTRARYQAMSSCTAHKSSPYVCSYGVSSCRTADTKMVYPDKAVSY